MLSIVMPTLNAAPDLAAALPALVPGLAAEVVVSDGGSSDDTVKIAAASGARVVSGPAGRGGQLQRGAAAATGDWLLFLHADTWLEPGAAAVIVAYMADPANGARAAVFRFRLDDGDWRARCLEAVVRWRCRLFALPYGDQGLLISRALYDRVGGFRPLPLMEDVDLVRRLGRRRLLFLAVAAVTSAARYRRRGYLRRMLRNLCSLTLYGLGVDPGRIKGFYER